VARHRGDIGGGPKGRSNTSDAWWHHTVNVGSIWTPLRRLKVDPLLGSFGGCGRRDAAEVSVFESVAVSFHR
jgi:hypothetical protein